MGKIAHNGKMGVVMSIVSSNVISSSGSVSYTQSARSGYSTVAKDVQQSAAERSTGIEDEEVRHVDAAEQKSKIDQLEKKIDDKEKEKSLNNAKSEEELSQLEKQLAELIDRFSKNPTNIRFSHSKIDSAQVIDVIDTETDETIRQIPSEEAIAIREKLRELSEMYTRDKDSRSDYNKKATSLLLDTKV